MNGALQRRGLRSMDGWAFQSLIGASILAHIIALVAVPRLTQPQLTVRSEHISVSVRSIPQPAAPIPVVQDITPEPVVEPPVIPEPEPVPLPVVKPLPARKPKAVAKAVPAPAAKPEPAPAPVAESSAVDNVARVVDVEPVPWSNNRPPVYPQSAQRRGQEGTVLLKLLVLPSGRVGDVTTIKSSGFTLLDDAARKAAQRYRFTPARLAGKPVEFEATVPFEFEMPRRSARR